MPIISVTRRDGECLQLHIEPGQPLMCSLQDENLDVEAVCGGVASCATCHIMVDPTWVARIPPPGADEAALLDGLIHVLPNSRLSCQILVSDDMDGFGCTVAPPEE